MLTVVVPSKNRATVNLVPRPQRRCTAMKMAVPNGRQMNAKEKIANDHNVPYSSGSKGKKTCGKTATQAKPKTKQSQYSEARPMITPPATSQGATLAWLVSGGDWGYWLAVLGIH